MHKLESNIWKYFLYILTNRRHYITILSIYFLTLPNATVNQIGLYMGIGNLAGFLFEIPSGYFADKFGHKRTLILAKIFMICSTLSFLFIQNFYGFVLGSALISLGFAFTSGTGSAFMHETLEELGRKKEYSKIMSQNAGNVSLISAVLIITLPFFTKISMTLPLMINLGFDIIGLIIAISFVNVKIHEKIEETNFKSIFQIFQDTRKLNFLPFAIFTGAILGFLVGESSFRNIYLQSLGYPVILVGFVMGLSRVVWFLVGRYIHLIEDKFTMKQFLLFEIFFFTSYYFLVAYLSQAYIVASIFIVVVGYMWGRQQLITNYVLNNHISDKNYKATILSIKEQISYLFQFIIPISIGYIMSTYSYKIGYYTLGVSLFLILIISYQYIEEVKSVTN